MMSCGSQLTDCGSLSKPEKVVEMYALVFLW